MDAKNVIGNLMPKAQSDDPRLLQAASAVLKGERHGYAWRRMVINYAAKRKSETKAWWCDGTVRMALYDWQEFQVATAEPTETGFVIFYNEFRFYHAADPTVRQGQWILHNRVRGGPIQEANINK